MNTDELSNHRTIGLLNGGFSLIEILVAITILGILLLPLLSFIGSQSKNEQKVEERKIALEIGKDAMEKLLSSNLRKIEIKDDSTEIILDDRRWKIVRDVIDGKEEDEPVTGTDPLEIWIRVYKRDSPTPLAELVTLKDDR